MAAAGPLGRWWAERVAAGEALPLALTAAVAIAALTLGMLSTAQRRRRLRDDLRVIVDALEGLRSGRGRGTVELASGSPLGLVADAVRRLGVELQGTWAEAEKAAERWRAVTDATRDTAIVTTDTDGDIRSFSAGASHLTGWDEGDVVARPAAMLFEENAYKDLLPKLARRSLRVEGVTTRSTMVRRDGTSVPAEVSVRLLLGSAGQPLGFLMRMRDVTDQIRVEDELRESERRHRLLVESLREGVLIVQDGRIAYANPAAERLCGEKAASLLGTAWRDRVSTHDVLVTEAALESAARGMSEARTLRCTVRGPDGDERASVRVQCGPVEFGGRPAVLLLAQDETAERRAEEELRRNEARLDAVLEATSDGVIVLAEEPNRMVQITNRAFAEMFGLNVDDLLGASYDRLARLLHAGAEGAGALVDRLEQGPPGNGLVTLGAGGRELEVRLLPLVGRDGASLGRVVTCRDVTSERRSQRDLQDQADRLQLGKLELERAYRELSGVNHELEQRGAELDRLNQELRRLDSMKSELIGNVSHELQTPLVSIRGYTEMILKERLGPISDEQRKGLTLSLRNIDRLISMIDNLLAFTRTDPELGELKLTRFPLRPVVEEARDLLRDTIAAKGLDVAVRVDAEGLEIRADRDKILQVLLNLLSNAVKFSHARGRIEIEARPGSADHATVVVRDEGVGIPEASLGRIFERHFQVQRPAEGGPAGSGIGLSIVGDILRLHGCTIEVASREGHGSEFTFTLPLSRDESRAAAGGSQHPAPPLPPPGPAEEPPGPARPRLRIIRRYRAED
jgi:PAS domain S-box-containing protein